MKYCLDWQGPYKFPDFFKNSDLKTRFAVPGVYIWIEDTPTGEYLSYVGKAGGAPPLFLRQQQHYANMIGGLYNIPKAFRESDRDWIPDWSRTDVVDVLLDRARFHRLVDEAFEYSEHCSTYLAALESAKQAKEVERQLLYDLQPTGTKWGRLAPPRSPVNIGHSNATWATEPILAQVRVLDIAN